MFVFVVFICYENLLSHYIENEYWKLLKKSGSKIYVVPFMSQERQAG